MTQSVAASGWSNSSALPIASGNNGLIGHGSGQAVNAGMGTDQILLICGAATLTRLLE